jgi:hypothetical protein
LIFVDPVQPMVIHHKRQSGDAFLTQVVREGTIAFDPPGIDIAIADIYEATAG